MINKLYPLDSITIKENAKSQLLAFWQKNQEKLPLDREFYGVYRYFGFDETGGLEATIGLIDDNGKPPFELNTDPSNYEIFRTNAELLSKTWERIEARGKQGLLLRAYLTDFEHYYPDGRVEIYISVRPHC